VDNLRLSFPPLRASLITSFRHETTYLGHRAIGSVAGQYVIAVVSDE
jgi:hypothetical protein